MKMTVLQSRFYRLSLGLISLGLGQRLLVSELVSGWANSRQLSIVFLILGSGLVSLAMVLLIPIISWFYQHHKDDRRLVWSLGLYLGASLLSGLVLGGLGQLVYDHTSLAYASVKTGIWLFSTLVQTGLKLGLMFALVSIHRQLPIRYRLKELWIPLGLSLITISLGLGVAIWQPGLGSMILSLLDAAVLLVVLTYFSPKKKEVRDEKTP